MGADLEVLHASERTRVTRRAHPGGTVICKEPLGPDARGRLEHEREMLERLRGAPGVVQLADSPGHPGAIVLVDVGGTSLAAVPKPPAVDELMRLAVELARAVAELHRRGVMHRDIAPSNIVVSAAGIPYLIDFALATPSAEVRPDFVHHSEIAGTLAYLAPEQTGRTGRAVDERADLYALGACLYELATGSPPFGASDPLQLVHDHLARVPPPPRQRNPALPAAMSDILLRLLEKEPDHRYQTADGLLRDLEAVRRTPHAELTVGARDLPRRLPAPTRIVGREDELALLREAFDDAVDGACRGVLVGGAAGVGKTALADELRAVVAGQGGFFVAGKFDEHRRDLEFDAAHQALRALGRLLLAAPEDELAGLRARILAAAGANAGQLTAVVPELAALLEVAPDAGDPLTAQARAAQAAVAVLRAVASPERPLVVFFDDLQWAGRTPLGVVDEVLSDEPIPGLLLLAAYRDDHAPRPLDTLLTRWREQPGVRHIQLLDLPVPDLVELVADVLRGDRSTAARLVDVIEPRTSGNPYETMERLHALQRDGVLTPTGDGWHFDAALALSRLTRTEVVELLGMRLDALPAPCRRAIDVMACLGGRVSPALLEAATGEPAGAVARTLAPALEEGLLVDAGTSGRFRHDRVREAVLTRLGAQRRRTLHLAIARRLATRPELTAAAAEQYLPVIDDVDDPTERRRVATLLLRAADPGKLVGDADGVNALLTAALRVIDPADVAALAEAHTGRHAALFALGRLEEADDDFRAIERLRPAAIDRADAIAVQVRSLSHRARFAEALELGLAALRECGIEIPPALELPAGLAEKFARLHAWLERTRPADDLARDELGDLRLLAAGRLIDAVLPVAYFVADGAMIAWLALEAVQIWIEHGPSRVLIGSMAHAAYQAGPQGGDNPAAHRALQRVLALGEAHGYEPGTSQGRHMAATMAGWFEPVEHGLRAARRAREGLLAGGEPAYVGYTYQVSVPYSLECSPSLASVAAEIDAGYAFLRRTGNEQTGRWLDSYRWLVDTLRGTSAASEPVPLDRYADDPVPRLYAHLCRGMVAAIVGDADGLTRHSAAAMELIGGFSGFFAVAQVQLLRGLALAEASRAGADGALAELDELTRRLAGWAADAPENFLHLLRLIEAERAWATGDFRAAVTAFDAARREVAHRQRPWHAALIAERAARFHLAHGIDQTGHELLADARRQYSAWGAAAKVDQLDWAFAPGDLTPERPTLTTGTIDLLGVLAASRALSAETSIERLHERVVEILGAMTGATGVRLVLWSDERDDWEAGQDELPLSVLRYVQRTREPLVVPEVGGDARFARDPYFAGVGACSLLAAPILSRGALRGLLVLENRLIRDAFTAQRLDAVTLIAGQLAVSLDNARLYADYRRIADEQAALRRVATLVAEGPQAAAVFDAVATEMQQLLGADGVTLGRYEPGDAIAVVAHRGFEGWQLPADARFDIDGPSVTATVLRTGRTARLENFDALDGPLLRFVRDLGVRASIGAPIFIEGRLWGVALVYWTGEQSPPPDTEERIAQFTKLLETAIANADSHDRLIASRARLLAAGDAARRRVVHDLHDGAQQRLVAAIVTLKLARKALEDGSAEAEPLVAEALQMVERGNEEVRELARGMLPTNLTRGGLGPAIEAIAARLDLTADVEICAERFPPEIEASAYFVVAEALTNIVKHARATRAAVAVAVEHGMLRSEVRDDGIGGADPRGHGLLGMSDRVAALGGRLEVESPAGGGTRVVALLPLGARRR